MRAPSQTDPQPTTLEELELIVDAAADMAISSWNADWLASKSEILAPDHPVYTAETINDQERRGEINGARHTYFCGAYWGYGFHEDGVNSALEVAKHFGKGLK